MGTRPFGEAKSAGAADGSGRRAFWGGDASGEGCCPRDGAASAAAGWALVSPKSGDEGWLDT